MMMMMTTLLFHHAAAKKPNPNNWKTFWSCSRNNIDVVMRQRLPSSGGGSGGLSSSKWRSYTAATIGSSSLSSLLSLPSSSTSPSSYRRHCTTTQFLLSDGGALADQCEFHIITSPYDDNKNADATGVGGSGSALPDHTLQPLPELVMEHWIRPTKTPPTESSSSSSSDATTDQQQQQQYLGPQIAIIDGSTGMTRTFTDFYQDTTGLAASLKYELGVTEHSTVCLFAPNHVDYCATTLAVGLCGAKITPVNPLYTKHELQIILDRSHSSVLIAHINTLDVALEAAHASKYFQHVIVMTEDDDDNPSSQSSSSPIVDGVSTLVSIKRHPKAFETTQREFPTHAHGTDHHPYLLPYSSGTTGLPKGVCLTHANLVANLLQFEMVESTNYSSMQPNPDSLISPLPFFHIYGMTVSNLYSAWKGHPVITMSGRFDLELFLNLIREHRPNRAHLVPPIILGLAKHPLVENYISDFDEMKCIISAAAPLGLDIELATQSRINVQIKQAWGMSELSPIATLNPDGDGAKPSSVGPLVPGTYGKVVDVETGKSLPAHTQGELCIKGPQVMLGYLDDPEKTAECLSDGGWLRTGDVAYYDDDGYIYITDRIKELIKVRGYQVAPAELEALLLTHDDVNDVAVIPTEDETSGELPRAYIVLKDGDSIDDIIQKQNEIYAWVKERVAPYKRLDGGIVFRESIPKSASGKILRRILRDEHNEERK